MPTMTMNGVTILPTLSGRWEVSVTEDHLEDGVPYVRTEYSYHETRTEAEEYVRSLGRSVPPSYTKG